jgi:hypothetical protein
MKQAIAGTPAAAAAAFPATARDTTVQCLLLPDVDIDGGI